MAKSKSETLRCSFCQKTQDVVGKLISSPSDQVRAYICDECIAVCNSILEDTGGEAAAPHPSVYDRPSHCLMCHPMAHALLLQVERWAQAESPQSDLPPLLRQLRDMARSMMGLA